MPLKKSKFECPLSAPIFKPTLKEFDDPLVYIEKIRPIAQKYGICKIISPMQWNPPFCLGRNTFKFRPIVQKLNEIGTISKVRNNFLRCLEAFWKYQGTTLEIPVISGIHLDLFRLHRKVCQYGGSYQVGKNKQWLMVCRELDIGENSKMIASQVKCCYEKIVQPYLKFCDDQFIASNQNLFTDDNLLNRMQSDTEISQESTKLTKSKIKTQKKLFSLTCKICESTGRDDMMIQCIECDLKFHIQCCDPQISDVVVNWTCTRCSEINRARELSRLESDAFGLPQSNCKYSLENFAAFADNFKRTYFNNRENVSIAKVEEEYWSLIDDEDSGKDVSVKYGADISSAPTSSGFPTKSLRYLLSENDQKYIDSGWNLNNLPMLNKSAFRFITNDLSGMNVPCSYVGMVFSSSCWHIEDHWSYSINYMHMGECKTWYGVPESDADQFEQLMRSKTAQLFEKSPDLLHHITTQINPTKLLENNIKVYRIDQAPGEFVVTFPRAYHSDFNQGFNFSEAVNFGPADWLCKSRASVENYRLVKRPTLFSHNELICKMAANIESLDILLLKAVYEEMVIIHREEKMSHDTICDLTDRIKSDQIQSEDNYECMYCRTALFVSWVTCSVCCRDPSEMACLTHVKEMCKCANWENVVLKYRLSLDDLSSLMVNVNNKLEQYTLWMTRLYHLAGSQSGLGTVSADQDRIIKNMSQFVEDHGVVDVNNCSLKCMTEKPTLEELKTLLQLGRKMNCPEMLLKFLNSTIDTCQLAMNMTDQLLRSHRIRINEEDKENEIKSELKLKKTSEKKAIKNTNRYEYHNDKLNLAEMRMLVEKLRTLPAKVPQLEEAAQTLNSINEWRKKVKRVLSTVEVIEERTLKELIEFGESSLVYLPEYQMLQKMKVYALWIAEAQHLIHGNNKTFLPTLDQLRKLRDDGLGLINSVEIDRIATLIKIPELEENETVPRIIYDDKSDYRRQGWNIVISNLKSYEKQLSNEIIDGESIQKEADGILKSKPGICTLTSLKTLLRSAETKLNCVVNSIERLKDVLKEALLVNLKITEMWQKLQLSRRLIHIDDMQTLIKQADSLCVSFNYLPEIKSLNNTVESWKKNLHELFIKEVHNSYLPNLSINEVLFPRPTRMFKLMIARESVSSKLVAVCKAESTLKKEDLTKECGDSCEEDKHSDDIKMSRNLKSGPRKNRGNPRRTSLSSDDPQTARKDNVSEFETFLRSGTSSEVESFNFIYKNMCINELEWMWNLRELNEDKARKDSSGHDFYCFCRKRGMDQKGSQVMCDLCQDWFHTACLEIQNKDMSKKKFLCPQCERSKRPAFEVILAEKRKLEQEAKMLKIPEHIALCLMSQRVISFHKHTNLLFSPQTELGAVFAEYKKLFGVQAILPKYQQASHISSQPDHSPVHDHPLLDTNLMHLSCGKQSRKTPHCMSKSGAPSSTQPTVVPSVVAPLSPILSKETLRSIHRLKQSLSKDARRELEEIYIELCLLEVDQPTVTWIWKLYHSLIDDGDDDIDDDVSDEDKYVPKQESNNVYMCDNQYNVDNYQDKFEPKLYGKPTKSLKKLDISSQIDKYVKQECLTSPDERKEPLQKFSFKRKLVAKNLVKSPLQIKKQTKLKPAKNIVTKKRGRKSAETKEAWEDNFTMSSQYYDEDDEVIELDNVEIDKQHKVRQKHKSKRVKNTSESIKSVSDSKSLFDDSQNLLSKHKSASGRTQRQSAARFYKKQISADKSDYSDENSPSQVSHETKSSISNHLKRGRKPSAATTLARETALLATTASATTKRRRRGGAHRTSGNKRVCNDDCEADRCIQQSSDKVNWIACDNCNLWYHWFCVGIKSELEIGDSFLCVRCKDNKQQNNVPDEFPSLDDEVVDDIETDDLNVTLDDDVTQDESSRDVVPTSTLTRLASSSSSVDLILRASHKLDEQRQQPVTPNSNNNSGNAYFRRSLSSPLSPPFLQPECTVQEEIVEISYVSHSEIDD